MRKTFSLILCILCCLFPLAACSQPEKTVEDHVNIALEQFGNPLGEAYTALGLPGDPEDAEQVFYLYAEDGVEVLGKQMNVAIAPIGKDEEDKALSEQKTDSVEYLARLDGDYAYPIRLYQALLEVYGEPEPEADAQPLSKATEASLEAMKQGENYAGLWKKENYAIRLSVSAGISSDDPVSSVVLEIRLPVERLDLPGIFAAEDACVRSLHCRRRKGVAYE